MRNDMNTEAREKLEDLLKTEPSSLTQPDIEFLKARADYLSDDQKDMLKKFDTAKKDETNKDADKNKQVNYKSLKKDELQKLLQDRKITFEDSAKNEDLIALLEDSDKSNQ